MLPLLLKNGITVPAGKALKTVPSRGIHIDIYWRGEAKWVHRGIQHLCENRDGEKRSVTCNRKWEDDILWRSWLVACHFMCHPVRGIFNIWFKQKRLARQNAVTVVTWYTAYSLKKTNHPLFILRGRNYCARVSCCAMGHAIQKQIPQSSVFSLSVVCHYRYICSAFLF